MQVTSEMIRAARGSIGQVPLTDLEIGGMLRAAVRASLANQIADVPEQPVPHRSDDQIVLAALMKRLDDHAELTQDELHDARQRLANKHWQLISYLKSLVDPASPTVVEMRSRPRVANTPDEQRCCNCGSPAVVYRNYREQPFCANCANGEPAVTKNGLEGPDVTDATGQSRLTANIPATPGSLGGPIGADYNPLKLISPEQIAQHLDVDQDTVDQWIQQGRAIGFPDPIQRIQAGPRFHLGAIDDWYRGYKALRNE